MKAEVDEGRKDKQGRPTFRVVDGDSPDRDPILNREGLPIDGGGHRVKGISQMLADEVNEMVERRKGS